jgi:hypothetical protein
VPAISGDEGETALLTFPRKGRVSAPAGAIFPPHATMAGVPKMEDEYGEKSVSAFSTLQKNIYVCQPKTEECSSLCACLLFLVIKKEERRGGEERDGDNHNPVCTLYASHPVMKQSE